MDRRDFLADLARLAALTAVVPNDWRVTLRPRFADDPFTLGVASGDPTPGGAVLWTRLAPRPLDPDGGMLTAKAAVDWEVAEDDRFAKVVQKGRATAAIELGYSVHVDVTGLQPDRWYWYRFRTGEAVSPVGMLRTTPAAGAVVPLAFAFMSCQKYDDGFFTAYGHLAREAQLDLAVHLGDYIYEGPSGPAAVRAHVGGEIRVLDDYRRRYAQYKSDPLLQAAHARCPWLVTWDDHEVDNNYAGSIGENEWESEEQVRARRAAGYQAWWEHQPVRVPRARSWADLTITRSADWGGAGAAVGAGHAPVPRRPGVRRPHPALWLWCAPGPVALAAGGRAGAVAGGRDRCLVGAVAGAGQPGDAGAGRQRTGPRRDHVDGPVERLSGGARPAAAGHRRARPQPHGGDYR